MTAAKPRGQRPHPGAVTSAAQSSAATPAERLFVYWPTLPPPAPGDIVTLEDGRRAVVETANFDAQHLHRRKLVVVVRR
jgi:hypothetical protein